MGLEVANNISELEPANPLFNDPVSAGDDHVRLLKQIIKQTFKNGTGEDGLGWNDTLDFPVDALNNFYVQISADENGIIIRTEESNTTKKYLEIGEAGAVSYQEPVGPIGSVLQSVLTESEMTTLYGANVYVLCNGQNIQNLAIGTQANSRLFSEFGIVEAPNMKPEDSPSLMLRQSVDDNRIGQLSKPFGAEENSNEIGLIKAFGTDDEQDGFLICDGREVTKAEYQNLFDVIGKRFGSSDDGATVFNLPDMRGRFLRGRDAGAVRDADRNARTEMNTGGAVGDFVGSVQADQFTSHFHDVRTNPRDGGSTSTAAGNPWTVVIDSRRGGSVLADRSVYQIQNSGGSETRPINAYVSFQIKYRSSFEAETVTVTEGKNKYLAVNNFIRIN